MLIPMMKIMMLQLKVVFYVQLPFRVIHIIFFRMELFKHHNVKFDLNSVAIIYSAPFLVGYLLTSLNLNFLPPPSITVCQLLPF